MNTTIRNILVLIAVPTISALGWSYIPKFVLWLRKKENETERSKGKS